MERRKFTREFKCEAIKLIKDRGVSYAKASEDLGVHPTQLREWVKKFADDPQHAFPGQGQIKSDVTAPTKDGPPAGGTSGPSLGRKRPMRAAIASLRGQRGSRHRVPVSKTISISGSIARRWTWASKGRTDTIRRFMKAAA